MGLNFLLTCLMNYGRIVSGKWTTTTESRPLTPVYPEPGPAGRRALTPMPFLNSPVTMSNLQLLTSNLCNPFRFTLLSKNAPANHLDSALTSKRAPKSFTSNTYEKHTQREGVGPSSPITNHQSLVTSHVP